MRIDTEQWTQLFNEPSKKANALWDARRQRDLDYEDSLRQLRLDQGRQDLGEDRRRYDLGREDKNRRFGDQLSIFRQIFGAPNPQVPQNAMMIRPPDFSGQDGGQNAFLRLFGRY